VLAHEYYSGLANETRAVVADAESWATTWAQVYANRQPQPVRPEVDFATDRVLVVALGQRGTGGFDIGVDSVVQFPASTVVYVRTVAPGQGCITTQALTQPVQLVRLPEPLAPFAFQERSVVRDCP